MFAPPPVLLSRAEIQSRLSGKGDVKTNPSHRHESQSPPSSRKNSRHGKGDKLQVSPPIRGDCPSPEGSQSSARVEYDTRYDVESFSILPAGFGEHPRQAPLPPKRPSPVLNTSREPPVSGAFPPSKPIPDVSKAQSMPPPIPPKSPKRQWPAVLQPINTQLTQHSPPTEEMLIDSVIPGYERLDRSAGSSESRPFGPHRAHTAPSMTGRRHSISTSRRASSQNKALRARGLVTGRVDRKSGLKLSGKQASPVAGTWESGVNPFDWFNWTPVQNFGVPVRRGTDSDIGTKRSDTQSDRPLHGKLQLAEAAKKVPHDTGLRQRNSSIQHDRSQKLDAKVDLPAQLRFIDKELPATPVTIMASPTEMHPGSQRSSQTSVRKRNSGSKRRSPLAQIMSTDVKANRMMLPEEDNSPSRLSAIPENTALCEKAPVVSESCTPVAMHIHLRGGSVVTVSPPEITPWQRIVYFQGPIKLPKPTIVPRKNSVASLEPFQEAIEQVYQEALTIPRRRSDDQVLDDVCEFFDEFGFESVSFGGDIFAANVMEVDDDSKLADNEAERFSTPPWEPALFGVGKTAAKYITEIMAKAHPLPQLAIPPVETEETLRARGIASLVHRAANHANGHRRGDSDTISKQDFAIEQLAIALAQANTQLIDLGVISGHAIAEELDASLVQVAPSRKWARKLPMKKSRNRRARE